MQYMAKTYPIRGNIILSENPILPLTGRPVGPLFCGIVIVLHIIT
jgi:hypothetical protein